MRYRSSIAGSLPKPAWLAETEKLWPTWRLGGPDLRQAKHDATRIAIAEQEAAGIECVTDGEQSRVHFVHGFLEREESPAGHSQRSLRSRLPLDRRRNSPYAARPSR